MRQTKLSNLLEVLQLVVLKLMLPLKLLFVVLELVKNALVLLELKIIKLIIMISEIVLLEQVKKVLVEL